MEVGILLFFLPPAVHVVVPGTERHWRNTAVHSYSSFILYLWYQMKVFPTYPFPPWICKGNCSSLRLLAEACSYDQSGNRTQHCLWHCGPHKWPTQKKKKEEKEGKICVFHTNLLFKCRSFTFTHIKCFYKYCSSHCNHEKKKMVIKPTDPAILSPEWLWDKLDREMCLNDAWGRGEVGRIINSCRKN